jgi:HEAT repeat protein
MMNNTLTRFLAAISKGDDALAEELVAKLDHSVAPDLRAMLSDASPDVRWWAVRALAAVQPDPQVIAAMLDDESGDVRACTALALAGARYTSTPQDEAIIDALVAHLADLTGVAHLCALALAHIGPAASPALVRALEENRQNPAVRVHAARALLDAAAEEAIPALIRALDDESMTVQYYAEDALERLGVGTVLFKP